MHQNPLSPSRGSSPTGEPFDLSPFPNPPKCAIIIRNNAHKEDFPL